MALVRLKKSLTTSAQFSIRNKYPFKVSNNLGQNFEFLNIESPCQAPTLLIM